MRIFTKPRRSLWEFISSLAAIGTWEERGEGMQQGDREAFLHASSLSQSTYPHVLRWPGGKQTQQGGAFTSYEINPRKAMEADWFPLRLSTTGFNHCEAASLYAKHQFHSAGASQQFCSCRREQMNRSKQMSSDPSSVAWALLQLLSFLTGVFWSHKGNPIQTQTVSAGVSMFRQWDSISPRAQCRAEKSGGCCSRNVFRSLLLPAMG